MDDLCIAHLRDLSPNRRGRQPRAKALLLPHDDPVSREWCGLEFCAVRIGFAEIILLKLPPAACIRFSRGSLPVTKRWLLGCAVPADAERRRENFVSQSTAANWSS